jgi:hypothetical protein
MQNYMYKSCVKLVLLFTTFLLNAVAAPPVCSSGMINNTGTSEWTPTSDFTINSDGTATHLKTGLMWKRCSEGRAGADCQTLTGSTVLFTWADALIAATSSNFAGYADWRLPNKKELESIVDLCGIGGSTNGVVFPMGFGDSWTSTTLARNPTIAFSVNFGLGTTRIFNLKNSNLSVLLVRSGRAVDSADLLNP